MQVWDVVQEQIAQRRVAVERLEAGLADAERALRDGMAALLQRTTAQLLDIAHKSAGDVEHALEAEAMDFNRCMLADQRDSTQLLGDLRVAEVQRAAGWRAAFQAAVVDWRRLRTQHAVQTFVAHIEGAGVAEPAARGELLAGLRQAQATAHHACFAQLATIVKAAPALVSAKQVARCANISAPTCPCGGVAMAVPAD
jgi:Domain of unknown function (DUF4455)